MSIPARFSADRIAILQQIRDWIARGDVALAEREVAALTDMMHALLSKAPRDDR